MRSAVWFALALAAPVGAFERGDYEIEAHYGMPHLDENLRHVRSTERRCLRDAAELHTIFPVLRDSSMQGCSLELTRGDAHSLHYTLACKSSQAPTGSALLQTPTAGRITGRLEVKGGGKNMTYSQSIEATRRGACKPR